MKIIARTKSNRKEILSIIIYAYMVFRNPEGILVEIIVKKQEVKSNEIVRYAHDEIRVSTDEICFADEIKSVLQPDEVGFHYASNFTHRRWIYPVR